MNMPKWAKWLLALIAFAIATVGLVWLSGALFFVFSKANPIGKTDFMTWWTYWQSYQDDPVIAKRLKVSAIVAAVVSYGIVIAAIIGAMRNAITLYGEARFANDAEVAEAGLFGNTGIIIGKWKKRFLMFPGMQFVLLAAPTRSGKGVGNVVPNMLNFSDSAVCLDVKLENFKITSKFRAAHGQEVFLFNPFSTTGHSHRYNPLGYVSDNPRLRVTDILAIGYVLYPGGGKDTFFDDAARNLFLGLVLYLCETPSLPRTFGEMLRQSSGKGRPIKEYIQGLITERNYRVEEEMDDEGEPTAVLVPITEWDGTGLPPLSMECVDALNRFTSTSDNTLSSILASFNTPLTLWVSPLIDAATSENDFDLRNIRKKRMTIYVGIPANKLAEAELIINLFFSQLINLNTDELLHATPEIQFQVMLMMDEFVAPGRIGIIDKSNSFMAGYGLRLVSIIQSPSQLEEEPRKGYGKAGAATLITNHACQILYTPRKQSDANEYSEMLGHYTFKGKGISRQRGGKNTGGHSESESDQKRPLMWPQELKEMSQRRQIVSLENTKPIMCEKIAYHSDHVFLDRLKSVSPTLAAIDQTPMRQRLRKWGFSGKAKPSRKLLEATWGGGELSSYVPLIDLDLHDAIVRAKVRTATVEDIVKGIDLRALAVDTSKIAVPVAAAGTALEPDQIEDFVNDFFDALDAGSDGDEGEQQDEGDDIDADGSSMPPSAEEMAQLEAEAARETGLYGGDEQAVTVVEQVVVVSEAVEIKTQPPVEEVSADDVQSLVHEQDFEQDFEKAFEAADELSDEQLAAMAESFELPDEIDMDQMSDYADMIATEEMEVPTFINPEDSDEKHLIDLSVLDKPLNNAKNTV
ncbi:type IV secretory system conjugative DNA transfer family protein [Pseudomonas sp. LB3P58]